MTDEPSAPDELRQHVKRAFVSYGLDEPDDEQCDKVVRMLRAYHAAWLPVTLDDLLRTLAPRRPTSTLADLDRRIREQGRLRTWFWRGWGTVRGWVRGETK